MSNAIENVTAPVNQALETSFAINNSTWLDQYEAIIEGEGDVDDSNDDANDGKKSAIGSLKSKSVCQLKNTVVDGDTRLHLVLVIQNCNTAWNRDINASNSIHLLACCLIDGVERPTVFCRPTTTTITTMGTATAIDTTKATNTPTVREN
ncbi:hypothetical protein BCR42DRAFT_431525 [Absidia repens]|uniref:Uncharacterized protein n=1 Tax=Absidia repens TaxID=90262 RepID=A0A1X2J3T5_9FUNG|nr:hypothetical protein BCR42DRAFT_431525 [Absidia repens]